VAKYKSQKDVVVITVTVQSRECLGDISCYLLWGCCVVPAALNAFWILMNCPNERKRGVSSIIYSDFSLSV